MYSLYFLAGLILLISVLNNGDITGIENRYEYSECNPYTYIVDSDEEKISAHQEVSLTNQATTGGSSKKYIALRRFNNKNIFTEQPKVNYSFTQPVISFSVNTGSSYVDISFLKFLRLTKMLC